MASAVFSEGVWRIDLPPSNMSAGSRVAFDCKGGCRSWWRNNATVLGVQPKKQCVIVLVDGGSRSGSGQRECVAQEKLMPLPFLSLSEITSGESSVKHPLANAAARRWKMAQRSTPTWRRNGMRLPSYVHELMSTPPPPDEADLLLGHADAEGGRAAILPSLFLPGFPKSATTWLYTCLGVAFTPERAGCGEEPAGWSAATCSRRFLLSPVAISKWRGPWLQVDAVKETFFFGGSRQRLYREDLLTLHGPVSAQTPPSTSE